MALATAWFRVLALRFLDRVGKGLRTAPRDALIAAAVPKELHGRAFGVHRAADTTGAFLGVLAAMGLLAWTGLSIPRIVLVAAGVGIVATLPLLLLREPAVAPKGAAEHRPHRAFAAFVAVSCVFAAGQASVLFVLLRAGASTRAGILAAAAWYLLFNGVYAGTAFPFGAWADRAGKAVVLGAGFALTAVAQLVLVAQGTLALAGGIVLLGLAWAATDGTGRALASELAGSKVSTRLGTYHAAIGLAALAGGAAGGLLWDVKGQAAFFLLTAGLAALAALAWPLVARRLRPGTAMAA